MAIPDDKTTLNFVLDKDIKAKLQVLADKEKRKLGNYVANILYKHIQDYEGSIIEKYGDKEFIKMFKHIFGNELQPEPINSFGLIFFFDDDKDDEDHKKANPNESIRKITIRPDGLLGHMVAEDKKKYNTKNKDE